MILSKEEDVITSDEADADGPLCFFDVLADYYVKVSERGKDILDLMVQLWSQSFASHIFSLLFHKWVLQILRFCFSVIFNPQGSLHCLQSISLSTESIMFNVFLLYSSQLFEVELDNQEILLRYSSALVQGATNVFW